DPAPVRGPGHPARRRCRPPVALVGMATPTPSTRLYLPLPTTGRLATMKITHCVWSTSEAAPQTAQKGWLSWWFRCGWRTITSLSVDVGGGHGRAGGGGGRTPGVADGAV